MYSAVLMLALTAGSETADFGRRGSCGCTGAVGTCSGVVVAPVVRHGCTGSCGGHVASGCNGCHGGGLFARLRERHSCHGGGGSCVGSCGGVVVGTGCGGGIVDAPPQMKPMPKATPEPVAPPKKAGQAAVPATIIVSIPAGARLTVDGAPTSSTSAQRTLVTPGLEVGTTYVYTMRAEVVREGVTLVQTQQVNVRGGETATVQFNDFATQGVASR